MNAHGGDPAEAGQQGEVFEQACGGRSPDAQDVKAVGDACGEGEGDDQGAGQA
jgi:hypothetical protein